MTPVPGRPVRMRWRWLDWPWSVRRAAVAAFLALLTWALLAPASTFEDVGELIPHQDKLAHGGLFLTLTLLARWAVPAEWGDDRRQTAVGAALACYAVAMEMLQALIAPGRTFEWLDIACNLAGLFAGWTLFAAAAVDPGRKPVPHPARPAESAATTRRRAVR